LDDAGNTPRPLQVTIAFGAGLTSAAVNREPMLEVAEFTRWPAVIAKSRSARRDRLLEYCLDRFGESSRPSTDNRRRSSRRRQTGTEQALACIYIPHARNHSLVEDRRLQRRRAPYEPARQVIPVEFVVERLRAEPGKHRVAAKITADDQVHESEASGIAEAEGGPFVGFEDNMIVFVERRRIIVEDLEPPGHAQMRDQDGPGVEPHQKELCAPVNTVDPASAEARFEIFGQGKPEVWPTLDYPGQAAAHQHRRQPPAHSLDLGKFRHGRKVARPRTLGYVSAL